MLDTTESHSSIGSAMDVLPPTTKKDHCGMSLCKPPRSPTSNPSFYQTTSDKPSLFMEWLERINVDHLDFARNFLTTPDPCTKNEAQTQNSGQESNDEGIHMNHSTVVDESSYSTPTKTKKRESKTQTCGSFRKMKTSATKTFKEKSIMIGNGWNAKGLEKARNGNWSKALYCWENALEIRQQVLGEAHPDVANTWNNIGIALGKLDMVPEAMRAIEKALELRIQHHGTEKHTEIAATYHNMANLHHQVGNYESALKLLNKSLVLSQSLLGKKDIQVARTRMAMGHTYYDAGEYRHALFAYREALKIMKFCQGKGDTKNGLDCSLEIQRCLDDIQETEKLVL